MPTYTARPAGWGGLWAIREDGEPIAQFVFQRCVGKKRTWTRGYARLIGTERRMDISRYSYHREVMADLAAIVQALRATENNTQNNP